MIIKNNYYFNNQILPPFEFEFPPAQPPATQITASTFWSDNNVWALFNNSVSWSSRLFEFCRTIFALASAFSAKSILPTH